MKNLLNSFKKFPAINLVVAGGLGFALGAVSFYTPSPLQDPQLTADINTAKVSEVAPATEPNPAIEAIQVEPLGAISPTSAQEVEASIKAELNIAAEQSPSQEVAQAAKTVSWHSETVKSGDNLSKIFRRAGLNDADIYELISTCKDAKVLRKIFPGQTLAFHIENEELIELRYQADQLTSQHYSRDSKKFIAEEKIRKPELRPSYHEGTINSSLFLAGQNAGLSDALIMRMATIFGWDVDFVLDIRQGDSFKVLYDEKYLDGKHIGNGPILAAEFTNKDKTFKAVRYTHKDGSGQYYTPTGYSMRKAFLRTPVDFARISSHFNLRRKHPVLNRIRAHKGTDYAAPRGTPIRAAGDGKIVHAGRKGGYGKAVILKHGGAYKTLYAHMTKYGKGIKNGKRVKQGQIIGYVGSTGLATGPHLHYEFHVNGRVRNPVTVKLPKAQSIIKSERERFMEQTKIHVAQMGDMQAQRQLASLEKPNNTL